jgi:hypothetical protein
VYVTWTGADSKPYLAVTRDQGNTWAGPFMVSTQDVTAGSPRGQVVAREPGHVALAYYGYTTDSTRLNGYLTESFDAAAAKPVFYSAVLNDPTQPLYFPVKSGTLPRNDYLGATFGPDGTPWTGMVKLLSDTADSQGFIQSSGFVGRMVPASGIGARPAAPAAVAQGPLPTTGATPPLPYWMALAALAVVIALAITPVGGRLR